MVSIVQDDVDDVEVIKQDKESNQRNDEKYNVQDSDTKNGATDRANAENNNSKKSVDAHQDTHNVQHLSDVADDNIVSNLNSLQNLDIAETHRTDTGDAYDRQVVSDEATPQEKSVEDIEHNNMTIDTGSAQSGSTDVDATVDGNAGDSAEVIAKIDEEKAKLEKELAEAKLSGAATSAPSSAKRSAIALIAGLATVVAASLAGIYYFRSVHRDNYAKFCKRVADANRILEDNHKIHLTDDYRSVGFEMDNSETKGLLMQFKNQLITRDVLMTKLRQCQASVKLFYIDGSDTVHIPFQLVDSIANYNVINNIAQYVIDVSDSLLQKTDNGLMLPDLLGRLDVLRGMSDADALKKYFQQHKQITVATLDTDDQQQCKLYRQLYVILQSVPSLYYLYIIAPEVFRSTQKTTEDNAAAMFVSSMIKMLGVQLLRIVKKYAY